MADALDLEPTPVADERPRELLHGLTAAHGLRAAQAAAAGSERVLDVWLFRDPPPELVDSARWRLQPAPGGTPVRIVSVTVEPAPTPHLRLHLGGTPDAARYRLVVLPPTRLSFDPLRTWLPVRLRPDCDDGSCFAASSAPAAPSPSPVHDYGARDWASLRRALLEFLLQERPDADLSDADPTVTLLELFAHVGDLLHYRLDRVATEAYLETARLRTSVRRHARLVDYRISDGVAARTHVLLSVEPGSDAAPLDVRPDDVAADGSGSATAFALEPTSRGLDAEGRLLVVQPALGEIAVYDWGEPSCCLPAGSTACVLVRPRPADTLGADWLRPGDLLAFELVDPGDAGGHRDWAHRAPAQPWPLPAGGPTRFRSPLAGRAAQVVELTAVERFRDPLAERLTGRALSLWRVTWRPEDALAASYPVSIDDSEGVPQVVVARGNVLPAHHGRRVRGSRTLEARWREGADPAAEPPLEYALAACGSPRRGGGGLSLQPNGTPYRLEVTVSLPSELQVPVPIVDTLLEVDSGELAAVADVEDDEPPLLRFATGAVGTQPPVGSTVDAVYEVGGGVVGNVPANGLSVLDRWDALAEPPGWRALGGVVARNPVPGAGGGEPEPLDAVRRDAPEAFAVVPRRAVLPDDLAAAAAADPTVVQRAAAVRGWTGSWPLVTTLVDLVGDDGEAVAGLQQRLDALRMLGTEVVVRPAIPVGILLGLRLCPVAGADAQLVRAQALAALRPGTAAAPGVFNPARLVLGTAFYASVAVAAVAALPLVDGVELTESRRIDEPAGTIREVIAFARDEVGVLDDDPARPERGRLDVTVGGGA